MSEGGGGTVTSPAVLTTTLHLRQHQLAITAEVDGGTIKQQVTDISS
jgi:hypothetical protein